jgi:hypothetical protein
VQSAVAVGIVHDGPMYSLHSSLREKGLAYVQLASTAGAAGVGMGAASSAQRSPRAATEMAATNPIDLDDDAA